MAFLDDYFLNPILQNGFFNPVNTLVYALVLVAAVYGVFRLLTRMKIPVDRRFFLAVLPFIFWGSSTRVLHDAAFAGRLPPGLQEFYSAPWFPTPGSYFITFALALAVLAVSLGIQRGTRRPYWQPMLAIGLVLDLVNVAFIPWVSLAPLLLVGGLALFWVALIHGFTRLFKHPFFQKRHVHLQKALSPANQAILAAHLLDAAATYISLTFYGYVEQHVVPNLLIPLFGPAAMFPLKILVVIPVLWAIDTYAEDPRFRNFLKLVVLILGLAPGLRDLLRLMAGV
ncbi:MAG: DUF63 family protein [Candidatus Aenigmarchaeota archaeon]|nr:DUF63 family protein [Candidatus Aenigmarchaeota archaeon]